MVNSPRYHYDELMLIVDIRVLHQVLAVRGYLTEVSDALTYSKSGPQGLLFAQPKVKVLLRRVFKD
jgi:hypothetical protein